MKHTEDERKKASESMYYEMWMLKEVANILDEEHDALTKTAEDADESEKYAIYALTHTSPPPRVVKLRGGSPMPLDERSLVIHNALVESFGIHARALLDFFYPEGHRVQDTDVLAEHFFPTTNDWLSKRPPKSTDELEKLRYRVAKEIAHLTYNRQQVTLPDKIWPTRLIVAELDAAFQAFKKSISSGLLPLGWD